MRLRVRADSAAALSRLYAAPTGGRVSSVGAAFSREGASAATAAPSPRKNPIYCAPLFPCPSRNAVSTLPPCPKCQSEYTYEDGTQLICPECCHEWSASGDDTSGSDDKVIKDSVGNVLTDGDTITVIKDLKVKGSSLVVKVGTKVKNIRLCDGDHDIDCKIDGIGAMKLKSEFVRKV
jgi:protein PhnA